MALTPLAQAPADANEYHIEAGDALEMMVIGVPDLRYKAIVNLEGNVTLPLVGPVKAAGLPLSEVRALVQRHVIDKILRQRTADGREIPIVIDPYQVTLSIAEHRPIYVDGDISKPGEQPFRATMTVRQAVAVAGGYDVARFRAGNPFLQGADLEGEYRVLAAEFVRQQTRIRRLEAELSPTGEEPRWAPAEVPISPPLLAQIQGLEADHYRARATDRAKEKQHLRLNISQADTQLKVLLEQQAREESAVRADSQDVERLNTLFERGNLTISRVTEARRSVLLSSTRLLQTTVQIERLRREREDVVYRLDRVDDLLRLDVTQQLQEARSQLVALRSRLQTAGEKILYTATIRSQLVKGIAARPEITIVRKTEAGYRSISAAEDAELRPGDVVQVSLAGDFTPDLQPASRRAPLEATQ